MKKCKYFIALSKEGKIINITCMNCTRVKQCYNGKTDNYVADDSSKKKSVRKTSKKKYNHSNIRDSIRKIGNNADKFVYDKFLHTFKFDNIEVHYTYNYEIDNIEIEDKEAYAIFPWSNVSVEPNSDEIKFLNKKFNIRKVIEENEDKARERRNRILNSINFGD